MNKFREAGFGLVPILAIVASVAILGLVGWRAYVALNPKTSASVQSTQSTSAAGAESTGTNDTVQPSSPAAAKPTVADECGTVKGICTASQFGFSFTYPDGWKVSVGDGNPSYTTSDSIIARSPNSTQIAFNSVGGVGGGCGVGPENCDTDTFLSAKTITTMTDDSGHSKTLYYVTARHTPCNSCTDAAPYYIYGIYADGGSAIKAGDSLTGTTYFNLMNTPKAEISIHVFGDADDLSASASYLDSVEAKDAEQLLTTIRQI